MQSAAAATRLSPRKYIYNIIIHYNVGTQTTAGAAEYLPTIRRCKGNGDEREKPYVACIMIILLIINLLYENCLVTIKIYIICTNMQYFLFANGKSCMERVAVFKLSAQPLLGDRMRRRIKRILKKSRKIKN